MKFVGTANNDNSLVHSDGVVANNSAYTVMFRVKLDDASGSRTQMVLQVGSIPGYQAAKDSVFVSSGSASLSGDSYDQSWNGGGFSGTTVVAGTWYRVALVRYSATSIKLFIDEVEKGEITTDMSSRTSGTNVRFGPWDGYTDQYLHGDIVDCKAFSRALTAAERAAEWSRSLPVSGTGLKACAPFLPGSTKFLDYTGRITWSWTIAEPRDGERAPVQFKGSKALTFSSLVGDTIVSGDVLVSLLTLPAPSLSVSPSTVDTLNLYVTDQPEEGGGDAVEAGALNSIVSIPAPSTSTAIYIDPLQIYTQNPEEEPGQGPVSADPGALNLVAYLPIVDLIRTVVGDPLSLSSSLPSALGELVSNPAALDLSVSLSSNSNTLVTVTPSALVLASEVGSAAGAAETDVGILGTQASLPSSSPSVRPTITALSGVASLPAVSLGGVISSLDIASSLGNASVAHALSVSPLSSVADIPSVSVKIQPNLAALTLEADIPGVSLSRSLVGNELIGVLSLLDQSENRSIYSSGMELSGQVPQGQPKITARPSSLILTGSLLQATGTSSPSAYVFVTADPLNLSASIPETEAMTTGQLPYGTITINTPTLYSVNTTVVLDVAETSEINVTTNSVVVNLGAGVTPSSSSSNVTFTSFNIQEVITTSNPLVGSVIPDVTIIEPDYDIDAISFEYAVVAADRLTDSDILPVLVEMNKVKNNIRKTTENSQKIWLDNVLTYREDTNTNKAVINILTSNYTKFPKPGKNRSAKVVSSRRRF